MNNKLSVKHHCIPQFYLNRFGTKQKNGSHQIFVYNKNMSQEFINIIDNIIIEIKRNGTLDSFYEDENN